MVDRFLCNIEFTDVMKIYEKVYQCTNVITFYVKIVGLSSVSMVHGIACCKNYLTR